MSIFIGYYSALEYWSSHDARTFETPSKSTPKKGESPQWGRETEAAIRRADLSLPLQISVASQADRRGPSRFLPLLPHVCEKSYPKGSFVKVERDVFLSSPEACFLQLAKFASFEELLVIGFELCGYYGMTGKRGGKAKRIDEAEIEPLLMTKRAPRTNSQSIVSYLEKASEMPGRKRGLKAARYLIDGSASPMETALALLLCLPNNYGGYGLPKAKLNFAINLRKSEKRNGTYMTSKTYWADLCWPEKKLIIEYDSDQFHANAERLNRDSKRRGVLEFEGFHVISVTKRQLFDIASIDEIAHAAASALGHRIRIRTQDFNEKQYRLRNVVFENVIPRG